MPRSHTYLTIPIIPNDSSASYDSLQSYGASVFSVRHADSSADYSEALEALLLKYERTAEVAEQLRFASCYAAIGALFAASVLILLFIATLG